MISDKFKITEPIHVRAVFHAIGQLQDVNMRGATVAEVARFMNVSKVTARKYLSQLFSEGDLCEDFNDDFSRLGRIEYRLATWPKIAYGRGDYFTDYQVYCQKVLKVIM